MDKNEKNVIIIPTDTELCRIDLNGNEKVKATEPLVMIQIKHITKEDVGIYRKKTNLEMASTSDIFSWMIVPGFSWSKKTTEKSRGNILTRISNEFKQTKKIKGYEVLYPVTNTLLWISHFDVEFFESLKNSTAK
jgi:hypothetical protein